MQKRGITLIALVVTIIVLIILAAVSLNLILGQNGIISRAQQASKETKLSAFKEKLEMEIATIVTDLLAEGKEVNIGNVGNKLDELGYDVILEDDGTLTVKTEDGGKATINLDWTVEVEGVPTHGEDTTTLTATVEYSTTTQTVETVRVTITTNKEIQLPNYWTRQDTTHYYKDYTSNITEDITITDLANNTVIVTISIENIIKAMYDDKGLTIAPIPTGFTESIVVGETSIDNGKVIKCNGDNSEFVWIPVPYAAIDVAGFTDAQINATIQNEVSAGRYPMAIKVNATDYKGVFYNFSYDEGSVKVTATSYATVTTNTAILREPVVLYYTPEGDTDSNLLANGIALTQGQFGTQLQLEYNAMVTSVIDNGGFYLGRYETSIRTGTTVQTKMGVTPIRNVTWWKMYQYQKSYATDNGVSNVKSNMVWGSQWDQMLIWLKDVPNPGRTQPFFVLDPTGMALHSSESGMVIHTTGWLAAAKTKNLYDIAGNSADWTQAATSTWGRAAYGGFFYRSSGCMPSDRDNPDPGAMSSTYKDMTSRLQLHL